MIIYKQHYSQLSPFSESLVCTILVSLLYQVKGLGQSWSQSQRIHWTADFLLKHILRHYCFRLVITDASVSQKSQKEN